MMPEFFNLNPLLTVVQAILLTLLSIWLIAGVFNNFVYNKHVVKGVSQLVIIGVAAVIISAPATALEVGRWLAATVGFG